MDSYSDPLAASGNPIPDHFANVGKMIDYPRPFCRCRQYGRQTGLLTE